MYAACRSLELITFKINYLWHHGGCGKHTHTHKLTEHTHTKHTSREVSNADRDECVLGNLSEAVADAAFCDEETCHILHCPPCKLLRNTDIWAKYVKVKTAHFRFTEMGAVPRKWISCGCAHQLAKLTGKKKKTRREWAWERVWLQKKPRCGGRLLKGRIKNMVFYFILLLKQILFHVEI